MHLEEPLDKVNGEGSCTGRTSARHLPHRLVCLGTYTGRGERRRRCSSGRYGRPSSLRPVGRGMSVSCWLRDCVGTGNHLDILFGQLFLAWADVSSGSDRYPVDQLTWGEHGGDYGRGRVVEGAEGGIKAFDSPEFAAHVPAAFLLAPASLCLSFFSLQPATPVLPTYLLIPCLSSLLLVCHLFYSPS